MRILRQKSQAILKKYFCSQNKSNNSECGVKHYHERSFKASSVFEIIWERNAFPLSILGYIRIDSLSFVFAS